MTAAPSDWRTVELGALVTPVRSREVPPADSDDAFIGMEHVASNSGKVEAVGLARDIRSTSPKVLAGDVLYGRLRPYLNKVTNAPFDGFASAEFIVLRPEGELDARFLRWRLASQDFVRFATSLNAGDRPRVKWSQIAPFRLWLPPLYDQRHIVDLIEGHLSKLDSADELLIQARERAGFLRGAVGEKLWSQNSVQSCRLSDLLEPNRISGRLIDQGWSPRCEPGPATAEAWGVLKTTAIQSSFFQPEENKALPTALPPRNSIEVEIGDLLMTRAGPRARCGVTCLVRTTRARLMLSDKMYRMRPKATIVDPTYLELYLSSPRAERALDLLKTGISESGLNLTQDRLLSMEIPLPSMSQQIALVAEAELIRSHVTQLQTQIGAALGSGRALRASLLQSAFSGRLSAQAPGINRVEALHA